ncbi:hypothetical protein [Mesorhizobium sp. GbtcB19]|uniref:hypothetical protein n=1 Tax=Mesorhizobium sp. GbtcB19 TaxID=2824764 RepID=UPI001C2FE9A6|nr:hypothetical protein [Mesorhizobium sp. GbtcB19]
MWAAYGKYGSRQASKAAFAAIADPDVDRIAERAAAWAASAKPGKRRMPLEKWLAEERYDEADRKVIRQPPPANDNRTTPAAKAAARHVEIERAEMTENVAGDKVIVFHLIEPGTTDGVIEGAPSGILEIVIESNSSKKQDEGQERLQRLAQACGRDEVESTDCLDFHRFTLLPDGRFRRAPQEILDLVYEPEAA